ncbi:MAG: hypothetical protein HQL23_07855 [Candidatus Omnitrophica bacterium]|nr:hypothetical protein [Candidatus Omnitrophota bacterium]
MPINRVFQSLSCVTLFALCYIHLQIQIVNLAYIGKKKEQQVRQLTEENGHLSYNIAMLKSASHLGEKLLQENSGLRFADPRRIVQISAPPDKTTAQPAAASAPAASAAEKDNPMLSLLSLTKE